jgi:hypothetical protein
VQLTGHRVRIAVSAGGVREPGPQTAGGGHPPQPGPPGGRRWVAEVGGREGTFQVGEGVVKGELASGLGSGLPRVAHGRLPGRRVPGGHGGPEVRGEFGGMDHRAFGPRRFQGDAQVMVPASPGGGGQVSHQDLAEQIVGEARRRPVALGHQHPCRGGLFHQGSQVGAVAERPGQQPGPHRCPVQCGQAEHAVAWLG